MRRCFVVIATVLMVAAVGVSQPANGAEPPPRPSAPPTTQGADRGWGKPKALHKFRPVTAKRSAAPSRSTVQAPGARRLLADLEGSKITPAQFARYAMAKYDQIEGSVPARYRDKNLELPDIAVLATKVTQAMTKASPAQRRSLQRMKARHTQPAAGAASRRSATTSDPCEAFDPEGEAYNCVLSSGQLRVMWATDGGSAMPAEKLNTDNDSNDIPDMIDETLATLQGAWTTYDDMGFTNPTGTITLRYSNGALVNAGYTLPPDSGGNGEIVMPYDTATDYSPAHELFHQFQYSYSGWPLVANANWFQESSAEWAAQEYMSVRDGQVPTFPLYARAVPRFLATTNSRLNDTDGFSGARQYGALLFVAYFEDRIGGDDGEFVKNVLQQMGQSANFNEAEVLDQTLQGYGTDLGYELPYFWQFAYTLCGEPGSPQGTRAMQQTTVSNPTSLDEQTSVWCTRYIEDNPQYPELASGAPGADTYRPPHGVERTSDGTHSWSGSAKQGGAVFVDLAGVTATAEDRLVQVEVSAAPGFTGVARIFQWNDNPADGLYNWWCSWDQATLTGQENATLTYTGSSGCRNATLMIVGTDAAAAGDGWDIDASWTARRKDTAITNGTITLGVRETGEVGTNMEGAPMTDVPWANIGFRHLASNADLFSGFDSGGWTALIEGADATQHRAVGATNYYFPRTPVQSFAYDEDEATSIVEVDGYRVKHHYHPSPNPNVYQCDVTIYRAPDAGPFDGNLTYRRSFEFQPDPGGEVSTTATRSSTAPGLLHLNDRGWDDMTQPENYSIESWQVEGPFTDRLGAMPQLDIQAKADIGIHSNFTLFYAANDQGPTAARGDLQGLGATAVFDFQPKRFVWDGVDGYYEDATQVGFAFGYKAWTAGTP